MSSRLGGTLAVVVAAGLLAACGATVSPATAVRRWAASGSFAQGVKDLLRDASEVHAAIAAHDSAVAVRTDCLVLFQDANGENTDLLPTPDAQLTRLLSAAYGTYVHAAAECDEHVASPSARALVQRDLLGAFGALVQSVLREEAVAGRSLRVRGLP